MSRSFCVLFATETTRGDRSGSVRLARLGLAELFVCQIRCVTDGQ